MAHEKKSIRNNEDRRQRIATVGLIVLVIILSVVAFHLFNDKEEEKFFQTAYQFCVWAGRIDGVESFEMINGSYEFTCKDRQIALEQLGNERIKLKVVQ